MEANAQIGGNAHFVPIHVPRTAFQKIADTFQLRNPEGWLQICHPIIVPALSHGTIAHLFGVAIKVTVTCSKHAVFTRGHNLVSVNLKVPHIPKPPTGRRGAEDPKAWGMRP